MAKTRIRIPAVFQEQMEQEHLAQLYETPLAQVLPQRTANALEQYHNALYVGQLIEIDRRDLVRTPGFGSKTVNEIADRLAELGVPMEPRRSTPK